MCASVKTTPSGNAVRGIVNLSQMLRIAAAVSWTASLFLPAFTEQLASSRTDTWSGAVVLGLGWMALLIACPAWLANPVLLWALIMWRRIRPGVLLLLVCIGIALALSWFTVPLTGGVPYDDGRHEIVSFDAGMYVWFLSFVLALAGAFVRRADQPLAGGS